MNLDNLRQLVQEEMSRFEFMKHLAEKHPDLNAKQIGEIYKLYKGGMGIDAAVSKVAPVQEQGRLGATTVSKTAQAQAARQKGKDIQSGAALSGIDNRERAIMVDLEKIIAAIAEEDDLVKYKAALQGVVDKIRKASGV